MTIEPFDLRQPCPYDVVLDRLTHWYHQPRVDQKAVVMDDLYVLNNPGRSRRAKHTSYCAMMRLGMLVPTPGYFRRRRTNRARISRSPWSGTPTSSTSRRWGEGRLPAFVKPYDSGAWWGEQGRQRVRTSTAYDASGTRLLHLQRAVLPFDLFVRALGVGPQVSVMRYDPERRPRPVQGGLRLRERGGVAAARRYLPDDQHLLRGTNSCEALRRDGVFHPIDFANAAPTRR